MATVERLCWTVFLTERIPHAGVINSTEFFTFGQRWRIRFADLEFLTQTSLSHIRISIACTPVNKFLMNGKIFGEIQVWEIRSDFSHNMYLVKYVTTMNYFYSREVFDRIYHVPDIFGRMCYMWHTLENYRCEKLERIFHMWCFRSNVSQLCGELSLFFRSFTAVKYWIEFLTSDIYGRISYMWHILVKYRCEKFGRIFHMWCILLNMWWLWRIWSNCSHLWTIQSYSSCLTYSVGTLHLIFSPNVGVRNSVGFFTCDVFCPVYHNLYEFDRFSTSVQYIIEFLTFDIIGQTSYTWPYRRI